MRAQALAPSPTFLISHLLGCSILWASGFLFIKLSGAVNPFAIAAIRGALGALALAVFFALLGRSIVPHGREWRDWIVLGTFNGWGPNVLVAYALTQITAASAAMIQASSPLIVALLAHAMFTDERLTARRMLGIVVGFIGMGVLIGPAALPDSGVSAAGALAMVGTAMSYAIGSVYARTAGGADPARLALGQQFFSAIPATLLAVGIIGAAAFGSVPGHLGPLLALGVLATAMPVLLFMRLIRGAGATRAAMVSYLVPVWATVLAVAFLGERVSVREVLGAIVVLAGVAIVSFPGGAVGREDRVGHDLA
jgi:drug/metabolite transporter (DMT)-like permease